jgi:hypothetical protein
MRTILAVSSLSLLLSAGVHAADLKRGEELHNERCMRCHDNEVYTRSDRRIKSLDKLAAQVRFCKNQTGAIWFDDEVDDVIQYLNQSFYKF